MAAAKRQLKVSSRSLPKHLAGKLNERLERIRDDPSLLLPRCDHPGGCPKKGLARKLARVAKSADSRASLRRLSRRGTPLARAYAGALEMLFEDTTPMLAGFKNPFGGGEVKFAQRGNAKRETQAGVQNYTDKGVRLLAYIPYARGFRGVYFFSTDEALYCSGRRARPPQGYLEQVAAIHRPPLSGTGRDFTCPHLRMRASGVPRDSGETHLAARFEGAVAVLRVCEACAAGGNLSQDMRKFAIGPKLLDQVSVWVELRPRCHEEGRQACHFDRRVEVSGEEAEAFHAGKLTDEQLLGKALRRALQETAGAGEGFVLAGAECLGRDHDQIIDALKPDPEMRRALEAALKGAAQDVVLDAMTSSKLLATGWGEKALEILAAACGDKEVASRVLAQAKPNEAPATLVSRAVKLAREAAIEGELPSFKGLSEAAALADRIARAYRRGGPAQALREIEEGRGRSPASGAVAWAFLGALGKDKGKEWQFTKVEMDRGAPARKAARTLLDCRAEAYTQSLGDALAALGVHETLEVTTT